MALGYASMILTMHHPNPSSILTLSMTLLKQMSRQQLSSQGLTPHQGLTPLAIDLCPFGTDVHPAAKRHHPAAKQNTQPQSGTIQPQRGDRQ